MRGIVPFVYIDIEKIIHAHLEASNMDHYLVDCENVSSESLKYLPSLNDGDSVTIFFSQQCRNANLDALDYITNADVKLTFHKVATGTKNALDFQLSSYLGFLIAKHGSGDTYHLVTHDKGFGCLTNFWKKRKVGVKRIELNVPQTEGKNQVKQKTKKSKVSPENLATEEEIKKYLAEEDEPEVMLAIFNQYKSKVAISNGISKKVKDSKRAGAIYQKLKPLLKAKHKS